MSTINQLLLTADTLRENALPIEQKALWLCELESRITGEVLKSPRYLVYPEDADTQLSVPSPYDALYRYYLYAQIDFAQREYEEYNNAIKLFNSTLAAYMAEERRSHKQAKQTGYRYFTP
ncbi:MAG: hypothetical protein RR053_04685 [Evtepia sp.]